jgi:hypothetical protein
MGHPGCRDPRQFRDSNLADGRQGTVLKLRIAALGRVAAVPDPAHQLNQERAQVDAEIQGIAAVGGEVRAR